MVSRSKATTHAEYLAEVPEARRDEIKRVDAFIRKNVPKSFKRWMVAGIMGYGVIKYKTKAGKEGDWIRFGLANNKANIALYVCAINKNGYVAEQYKKLLPKASIGKSCVRFKKFDDLDPKVVAKMLKDALKCGDMHNSNS